jgi:hypothetical protein
MYEKREKLSTRARDWLLALLRFAVTREREDRLIVLSMAFELDRSGMSGATATLTFFTRTSIELCNAIADKNGSKRDAILRRQLARIEDCRLKRSLEAAFELLPDSERRSKLRKPFQNDIWRGLRART